MRKIIIATHGNLAQAFVDTVHMITGLGENLHCLCMNADTGSDQIRKQLNTLLSAEKQKRPIFILTDVFGGSITNICTEYTTNNNIHIISGVNLPMILELACLPTEMPDDEVVTVLLEQTKQSILYVNELIQKESVKID